MSADTVVIEELRARYRPCEARCLSQGQAGVVSRTQLSREDDSREDCIAGDFQEVHFFSSIGSTICREDAGLGNLNHRALPISRRATCVAWRTIQLQDRNLGGSGRLLRVMPFGWESRTVATASVCSPSADLVFRYARSAKTRFPMIVFSTARFQTGVPV